MQKWKVCVVIAVCFGLVGLVDRPENYNFDLAESVQDSTSEIMNGFNLPAIGDRALASGVIPPSCQGSFLARAGSFQPVENYVENPAEPVYNPSPICWR